MNKAFIAIASIIVMHFMIKSWKKAHDKPTSKEDVYRQMIAEHEALRAATRSTIAKMDAMSTSKDQCDAMAMAPGRLA